MQSSLSPYIRLSLSCYVDSVNLVLLHMQKLRALSYKQEQRNWEVVKKQFNYKFVTYPDLDISTVFKTQISELDAQTRHDYYIWMDEISTIRQDTINLIKSYMTESSDTFNKSITNHFHQA